MGGATYLDYEPQTQSADVLIAKCLRLNQDLQLCAALRAIHEGDMHGAARRLDLKLCEDIVALNSQLASADAADRAFVENVFARISLIRPTSDHPSTGAMAKLCTDQIAAERILAQAVDGTWQTEEVVSVSP